MNMRWVMATVWGGALSVASGCADPCSDDGLGQEDCPVDADSQAGTDSASDTQTTGSASATMSESNSATATMGSASASATTTDSTTGTDSVSATATISDSVTDGSTGLTDGSTSAVSATLTDGSTTSFTTTGSTSDGSTTSMSMSSTGMTSTATTGGQTALWCLDGDMDGFGDPSMCMQVDPENPPPGYVPADLGEDCDDTDDQTFPGAAPNDDPLACMTDADMDDYGDNTPGPGVTPGTDCDDDDPGIQICALLVTQDGTTDLAYDEQLIDSMQAAGYAVTVLADTDATAADAAGMTLLVISETAQSTDVLGEFRDVAVPAVVLEGLIWDDMDMAPQGNAVSSDDVLILDAAHPLAGGLAGVHDVIDGQSAGLFHTDPADTAAEVIARQGNPGQIVGFGFEAGAAMQNGFAAPARRVGLGYDADQNPANNAVLTDAGQTLFEAAIAWVVQ